jgi:hypothetical protein
VGKLAIYCTNSLGRLASLYRLSLCCSIGLCVVFDPRSHTRYPPYELMSHNRYVCFCWTWYQEKRGPCRSIPDEKSKTIPVPGGAVLSSFRIESQLCPGLKSRTQRVTRHISRYCPQNSAYTDWFCPGGSVCSIPLFMVCPFFKWRDWKLKKSELFENVNFWRSFFFEVLLISQNRDRQPTVKFHRQHDKMHIYWLMPRNKHLYVVCSRECSDKPPKSAQLEWYQKWQVIQGNQAFFVSVDRWNALLSLCQIWSWVVHLFHKKNELKKSWTFFKVCPFFKLINEKLSLRWKRMDSSPWKAPLSVGYEFSRKVDNKPHLKFYKEKLVLPIYRKMPRVLDFGGWNSDFRVTEISRCYVALCSVQRSIHHRHTSNLISFGRSAFHHVPCGVWKGIIHLHFANKSSSSHNLQREIVKFL